MQKIQKFQFGRLYAAPKSAKTYELINRDGLALTFKVRNPKTRDSWKMRATSAYKADENGAFEEVLFSDGARLRADACRPVPRKNRMRSAPTLEEITQLMETLAA